MKLSTDRILTTHVGSLPRPDDVAKFLLAKENGDPVDQVVVIDQGVIEVDAYHPMQIIAPLL